MFNAKNLMLDIGGAKIPCAVFGKGKNNLIMLPGLGDGLTTVKGKALPMVALLAAYMVRKAEGETMEDYLSKRVFADAKSVSVNPDPAGVAGFQAYLERYKAALAAEKAAEAMQ